MEQSKFFKFVWKFNGVVLMFSILLIMLLALVGVIGMVYDQFKDHSREGIHNVLNINKEKKITQKLKLGHLTHIEGSSCVIIPLLSKGKSSRGYASSSYGSFIKNYLFIDNKTHTEEWLFPENKFLIHTMELLKDKKSKVKVIIYQVIKDDSNNDNKLNRDDLKTIALSSSNGKDYTEVIDNVDKFIGNKLLDADTLLFVYQREGKGFFAKIDINTLKLIEEKVLPKIGS